MNPLRKQWILRSLLFVPGHQRQLMEKACRSAADAVVLDLEDAVPSDRKAAARETVFQALQDGVPADKTLFLRVNSLASDLTEEEVTLLACERISGFVYPQANSSVELSEVDYLLKRVEKAKKLAPMTFSLIPILESPRAILHAFSIATSTDRIIALIFGCEDYLAALQGRHNEDDSALLIPRALTAAAARAAGVEPIDAPFVRVHDLEGLRAFAEKGRDLGMSGMLTLSPKQIPIIHQVYTPSDSDVERARRIIAAAQSATSNGVFLADGDFISPPTVRAARNLLARAQAIEDFVSGSADKTRI
jgi:citrate lyase subunit beta/citryl-CoA lyase